MLRNLQWLRFILVSALLFCASTVKADSVDEAFRGLREGKAVAIMRHALAPGFSDPAGLSLGDCQTRRNLSEAGRVQSRYVGELFRSQGIEQAQVFSSEWCRCRDVRPLQLEPSLSVGNGSLDSVLTLIKTAFLYRT